MYPLPSTSPLKRSSRAGALSLLITLLILASQTACGPTLEELNTIKYTPLERDDWLISTPTEQQLDPLLVAELYFHAAELDNIRGLLVVKNGFLIAEDYFNGWSVDKQSNLQSVTKSYTSALTGIALQQGHLSSVDQKMMDFFPELSDQITDPRKNQITIRHLLQMRAGYPWEESTDELMHVLLEEGFRPSHLVSIPLVRDPGTGMEYSNLTSHLLGVILARATETDLKSYAQEHLFSYLGAEPEDWLLSWENYYMGFSGLHLRARDLARFGQLYLDSGVFEGTQVLPANWPDESLQTYSQDAWSIRIGKNVKDMGYGYQWWSVRAGENHYNMAWGHGGQQIALVQEHNMVVVVLADPLNKQHGSEPWKKEKACLNLVGDFVASLP